MKLFVSYARVDKPFCKQLIDLLDIHEVWYDYRLQIGQNWWDEILERLHWAEGVVFLVSPDSLKSQYCNEELDIALSSGKHIFPVMIRRDVQMPEKLFSLQYADFSGGIDVSATKILLNAISMAERKAQAHMAPVSTNGVVHSAPMPKFGSAPLNTAPLNTAPLHSAPPHANDDTLDCFAEAIKALDTGELDRAVYLLKRVCAGEQKPRFVDVAKLLAEAESKLEAQIYQREAEREYAPIMLLLKNEQTRGLGCNAFRAYLNTFPDYDPQNLRALYDAEMHKQAPLDIETALPLLSWCPVTQGNTTLHYGNARKTFVVKDFQISQYPITNQQYQAFIDAPDGYHNPTWWERSNEIRRWHVDHPQPIAAPANREHHPRVNINWYEALAFCDWLSYKIGYSIRLATEQQWQRAALGDTRHTFTWGGRFDKTLANT